MLEFFELTASGSVYFRVATSDALVELGNADLPLPPRPLEPGVPRFTTPSILRVLAPGGLPAPHFGRCESERNQPGQSNTSVIVQG